MVEPPVVVRWSVSSVSVEEEDISVESVLVPEAVGLAGVAGRTEATFEGLGVAMVGDSDRSERAVGSSRRWVLCNKL